MDSLSGSMLRLSRLGVSRTRAGQSFNVQSNGQSAIWISCEGADPGTVVVFDSTPLATSYGSPDLLTALVPARLYRKPGTYLVFLATDRQRSNALEFVVEPSGDVAKTDEIEGDAEGDPVGMRSREVEELRAVPACAFDCRALRALDASDIALILRSPEVDREWRGFSNALAALELPEMTGGVNPGDQRAIYYLVRGLRFQSVLEIGTFIGCSTVNAALALRQTHDDGLPVRLVSVDIADVNDPLGRPWIRHSATRSPRELIESVGCRDFTTFEVRDSIEYLEGCTERFDLVFLDGLHTARRVYLELSAAMRCLKPGGAVLLHDYFPDLRPLWSDGSVIPGPFLGSQRAIGEGANLRVIPLGHLPWPTKLGSDVTSLALVVAVPGDPRAGSSMARTLTMISLLHAPEGERTCAESPDS